MLVTLSTCPSLCFLSGTFFKNLDNFDMILCREIVLGIIFLDYLQASYPVQDCLMKIEILG